MLKKFVQRVGLFNFPNNQFIVTSTLRYIFQKVFVLTNRLLDQLESKFSSIEREKMNKLRENFEALSTHQNHTDEANGEKLESNCSQVVVEAESGQVAVEAEAPGKVGGSQSTDDRN